MAAPAWLVPLLVLGGGAAFVASKQKRASAKLRPPSDIVVVDNGIGFSKIHDLEVRWNILRKGALFGWAWTGQVDATQSQSSAFVFPDADSAKLNLQENADIVEVPKPTPGPMPTGELDAGAIPDPPIPPMPPPAFWAPPPPGSIIYPPKGDSRTAPVLEDPEDLSFSDDCAVVVVGPEWWDKIGDFVAAMPDETAEDLFNEIIDAEFPAECDFEVALGARQLRDELWERISKHVAGEQ